MDQERPVRAMRSRGRSRSACRGARVNYDGTSVSKVSERARSDAALRPRRPRLRWRGRVAVRAGTAEPGRRGRSCDSRQRDQVMKFGDDFKQFIGGAKSATDVRARSDQAGRGAGFKPWPAAPRRPTLAPGSRWYAINRGRTIVAFVVGTDPLVTAAPASSTPTTIRCSRSSSQSRSARASTSRCSIRSPTAA